ncbi:MAG: hypothetical protein ABIN18_22390 [Pseudomonadota bacterium]
MSKIVLAFDDIGPLERSLKEYAAMGSGLVYYKGEGWDWRMARYALEDLKARKEARDSRG